MSEMYAMEDDAYEADQKIQNLENGYEDEDYTIEDGDYTIEEDPSHQFTAYTAQANSYMRGITAGGEGSYNDQSRGGSYKDRITAYSKSGRSYRELTWTDHNSLRSNRGVGRAVPVIAAGPYNSSKSSVGQAANRRGGAGAASVDDTLSQSELGWDEASASQYG